MVGLKRLAKPRLILSGAVLILGLVACSLFGSIPPTPTSVPAAPTSVPISPSPLPTTSVPPTQTPAPSPTSTLTPAPPLPGLQAVASPSLYFIAMQDQQNGWALSEKYILRTVDGGHTWGSVNPQGISGPGRGASGFFLDRVTAWVIIPDPNNFAQGTLYRTADGGQTWQSASVPFGGGPMQFLDPQNGWVMNMNDCGMGSCAGAIYHTADGGSSWAEAYRIDPSSPGGPSSLPLEGDKNGIAFLDENHGWVGGTEPRNGYVWLFATQDGGKSWSHQDLVLPSGFESGILSVDAPKFFSATQGILPVGLFTDSLYRDFYVTQDGGATWSSTTPVNNGGVYSVVSQQEIFVWDGTKLDASADSGQTWNSVTPNLDLSQTILQIDFVDPTNGWAISQDANGQGALYATRDGGATWTALGP